MTLSENQVRHIYVASGANKSSEDYAPVAASAFTADGDFAIALTKDGNDLFLQHRGKGGLTRSDLIPVCNILYANATAEADMEKPLKTATIAGVPATLPKGTYIVRITINNYVGMSDEDTYFKYGQVTSNGNMSAAQFYQAMKTSLEKNMSRETVKMFDITGGTSNVVITEVEQPWELGTMARTGVNFEVELVANDDNYEAVRVNNVTTYDWGTVTMGEAATKLKNSKDIADMEYFCMGERGDFYRGINWPNNIKTKYMVNAESATGYAVLDIHYAYVGANESVQKSEKTITIVSEDSSKLDAIIAAIEANSPIKVNKSTNWA